MTEKRRSLAKWVRWGGTVVSLGLFVWLMMGLNWSVLWTQMRSMAWWTIPLALGLYLTSQGFNTLRWCTLLWSQEVKISFWQAFRITWSGIFASNFLPSTIGGDGLRMVAIFPYTGSKTVAIGSVALDRVTNMAAMTCLIPVPLALFGSQLSTFFAVALPLNPKALLERYFPKIAQAFREWASRPQALLWAFLVAWPSNLVFMLAAYTLARQLGMQVTFVQVMAVQTVTYFLSVLPISVNGLGVREVTYTTLFVALGATLEQASALAVLTRFLITLVTVPGAIWVSKVASDIIKLDDEP